MVDIKTSADADRPASVSGNVAVLEVLIVVDLQYDSPARQALPNYFKFISGLFFRKFVFEAGYQSELGDGFLRRADFTEAEKIHHLMMGANIRVLDANFFRRNEVGTE